MSSQFIFAITTPVGNEAAGANEYSLVAFFYSIQAAVLLLLPHLLSSVWWWTENNYNFGSVLILRPEFRYLPTPIRLPLLRISACNTLHHSF